LAIIFNSGQRCGREAGGGSRFKIRDLFANGSCSQVLDFLSTTDVGRLVPAEEGKNNFEIRDLFADERCTRSILDFPRAAEVGRTRNAPGAGQRIAGARAGTSAGVG